MHGTRADGRGRSIMPIPPHIAIHRGRPGSPASLRIPGSRRVSRQRKGFSPLGRAAFVAMGDLEAAQKLTADAAVNREMATKWAEAV